MLGKYLCKLSNWARKYAVWLLVVCLVSLAVNLQLIRLCSSSIRQYDSMQQTLLYNAAEVLSRNNRRIDQVVILEERDLADLDQVIDSFMYTYQLKIHLASRDIPAAEKEFFYRVGGAIRAAVEDAVRQQDEESLQKLSEASLIIAQHIHQLAHQLSATSGPLGLRPPGIAGLYRETAEKLRRELKLAGSWDLLSAHMNGG